ncbi:hypothetical protein VTI74DRAFT_8901 [Chaetomium olivicolor]
MATSPRSPDGGVLLFDSARPFRGVVVCCTSISTELRADIAAKTAELGGVHKYDLTPDCTHLIVGNYDTPKYRHVAKERPDIRVMAAGWVEAVRNLWVQDADIDFLALEREWQLRTFEAGGGDPTPDGALPQRHRLLCCMTGFEDPDERQQIVDKIEANGGVYTGDLTRRVTHLIVYKPEGRKYKAAKSWEIRTVTVEWVNDSVERGLILDEKLYDPMLPPEMRGVGAWNKQRSRVSSLGKRLRETAAAQDEGKRKLRKTASMKLNSQRDNLWGDILGKPQASEPGVTAATVPGEPATAHQTQPTQPSAAKSLDTQGSKLSSFGRPDDTAVFASCCFFIHGFSRQKTEILVNTVASLGGLICHTLDEVVSTSGAQLAHRFLIVPQYSLPDTHPQLPENVHIITEYYIERCLHKKYFFDPSEHVIGRPFPLWPIPGFEELSISTAGFTGVDLNQVHKSVIQLGAKYEERFTANVSLLMCPSLAVVRKQKLELAVAWKVPVVRADWLWECISTGYQVPIKGFLFPELKQDLASPKALLGRGKGKGPDTARGKFEKVVSAAGIDKDLLPRPATKPKQRRNLDESAFVTAREEPTAPQRRRSAPANEHDSNTTTTTHFETAPTHILPTDANTSFGHASFGSVSAGNVSFGNISFGKNTLPSGAPLSDTSSSSLNKPPSPTEKQPTPQPRKPLTRISSEIADSEATEGDVGEPSDIPPHDNDGNTAQLPAEADPESEKKRDEAEKAAAERLAISTKLLTSLLSTAGANTTITVSGTTPVRAVSAPLLARLEASTANATDDGVKQPKRRKRNIFGRAISNASAASSSSDAGSYTTAGAAAAAAAAAAKVDVFTAVDEQDAAQLQPQSISVQQQQQQQQQQPPQPSLPPKSTQVGYEDPEARRHMAEVMSKMMGENGTAGGGSAIVLPVAEEKLTLAGMGGYEVQEYSTTASESGIVERFIERRRTGRRRT